MDEKCLMGRMVFIFLVLCFISWPGVCVLMHVAFFYGLFYIGRKIYNWLSSPASEKCPAKDMCGCPLKPETAPSCPASTPMCPAGGGCPIVILTEPPSEGVLLFHSVMVTQGKLAEYMHRDKEVAGVLNGLFNALGRINVFLNEHPDRHLEVASVYADIQTVLHGLYPILDKFFDSAVYVGKQGYSDVLQKAKDVIGPRAVLVNDRLNVLFGDETKAVVSELDALDTALNSLGTGTKSDERN